MPAHFSRALSYEQPVRATASAGESLLGDAEAMRRLARGEIAALGELYDRHHAAVRRFVARASSNGSDTEDLVQSTFLALHRSATAFDATQSCRAWLLGIAARLVQRERTTRARWSRLLQVFWSSRAGASADPERALAARHELGRLEQALSTMSAPKRIVLVLSEIEGLSGDEIAQALQIPVGTVWTRLHHARRELARALDLEERTS